MLEQRVSIYKNKTSEGGVKTTIVADNVNDKTIQAIVSALYGIGINVQVQDVNGYTSTVPTKTEEKAMESAAIDTSDMALYATTSPEEEAALMAEGFFNENFENNYPAYLSKVVTTGNQADVEHDAIMVKAMYMAADRLLQGDFSGHESDLKNYLYVCSYMSLFKDAFRAVAQQKGASFNESPEEYSNCIIYLLQNMTLEEMNAIIGYVQKRY